MENAWQFIVLAFFVESIVNTVKPIYDKEKRKVNFDVVLSLIFGVGITILVGKGLFGLVGLDILLWAAVPSWVSLVLDGFFTGIMISRGSNFIHDTIEFISQLKN